MNKTDFKFSKFDPEYQDYWFEVSGNTKTELTDNYFEMCMIEVTDVVYSKVDNMVGIKRLFPFNYDVIVSDNNTLKTMLSELTKEIDINEQGGTTND